MIRLTPNLFFRCWRPWSVALLKLVALSAFPVTTLGSVNTAIAWSPSSDANVTGYNVYYGTTSHTYTSMIAAGSATNSTINNLQSHTTYFFSVKSHNDLGDEGEFSPEAAFTGYATTPASGALRIKTFPTALKLDQLIFSLAPGAPAAAGINPTNGLVTWSPGLADANTIQTLTVIISDLTNPSASTQQTIVVTVSDFFRVALDSVAVQTGLAGLLSLSANSSDGITNLSFNVTWPGEKLLNPKLTFDRPIAGGVLENHGTNLGVKLWTANGELLTGTNAFAHIHFLAQADQTSAFLAVPITSATANKANGATFSNLGSQDGEVVVVGTQPLLRPVADPDQGRVLSLYTNPALNYQIQFSTNLTATVAWQTLQNFQPTNLVQRVNLDSANPNIFYRLMQL